MRQNIGMPLRLGDFLSMTSCPGSSLGLRRTCTESPQKKNEREGFFIGEEKMSLGHCFVAGLVGGIVGGGLGAYLSHSFLGALTGGVALGGLFAGTYLYSSRKKRDTRTMVEQPADISNKRALMSWTGSSLSHEEEAEEKKREANRAMLERKKQEELKDWGETSALQPGDYGYQPQFDDFGRTNA